MSQGFVHLRLHTEYSLSDSVVRIPELIAAVCAAGMPAVAVTDQNNLFAMVKFYREALKAGVKPLVGIDLLVREVGERQAPTRLTLLCQSQRGYRNLARLVTRAYLEGQERGTPRIERGWLEAASLEGLIGLSCATEGDIGRALLNARERDAERALEGWLALFPGRFYLELQRLGRPFEEVYIAGAVSLAARRGVPVVATNDVRFLRAEEFESHEARVCIHDGALLADSGRVRRYSRQQYLRSPQEMAALFADVPEALANSVEIARRCSLVLTLGEVRMPQYPLPAGVSTEEFLRAESTAGLAARFADSSAIPALYHERLDRELEVICQMGFAGYFLIVADFIRWARGNGVPVGPGRGSGAGSLVAWALTITDLDPIRFDLLFERFLNPERVSMPDFDIDFCQDRRGEVIDYVQGRYGRDQVAQIITFGTLQARGVLRDVGRVLQMPYGQVDKLCKLVPQNPTAPISLKSAIDGEPRLQAARDAEPVVRRAFDIAQKLEGLHRHASTHAAGIVIGERSLSELVPLYRDPKSLMPVTQFNMKWVEPAGLVKFDFLGLKTLTVLDLAVKLVRRRDINLDLSSLPLDDTKTYEMLAHGETVGVFQVESQGMRRALVDMRPDRFEDLIVLVALYRPGPMANIPTYCARKLGHERTDYLHPKLEPILQATYGIITYQEQVQQIARDLAGYTLGQADILRRAMGKKDRKEMASQRDTFISGAVERGIGRADAEVIFETCAKFAEYGFNKSHSAPYALLTYQTAYMKANYPVEFLAASMTLDTGNTDKLAEFRAEAERLGIKVEPPSINRSSVAFEVDGNTIFYALAALRGVGRQAVESIIAARGEKPFADLGDFGRRVNPKSINKRVLESLAAAGAFDVIEPNRAAAFAACETLLATAQRTHDDAARGQSELFGGAAAAAPIIVPALEPWLPAERLQREYEAVGFFLTGHPLDDYAAVLRRLRVQSWVEFSRAVKAGASAGRVAGTVVARTERRTKNGSKMGIIGLSDPSGAYEAVLFAEGLAQYRDLLEPGTAVLLFLTAEVQGDEVRARIQSAEPLDQAAAKMQKGLRVFLRDDVPLEGVARRLEPIKLAAGRSGADHGDGEVSMVLMLGDGNEVEVKLPGRFKVSPQIAGAIKAVSGVVTVEAL